MQMIMSASSRMAPISFNEPLTLYVGMGRGRVWTSSLLLQAKDGSINILVAPESRSAVPAHEAPVHGDCTWIFTSMARRGSLESTQILGGTVGMVRGMGGLVGTVSDSSSWLSV